MKSETQKEELMRRYFLDEMSDNERQSIEEMFLENNDFFEEITAFEDELFYEYKQNRLTPKERIAFEEKFLQSAQDKEKAAFAEAFLQATEKNVEENRVGFWQQVAAFFSFSNPALRVALPLAAILLVSVIGFWLFKKYNASEIAVNLPKNSNLALLTPTPPQSFDNSIEEKQKEQQNLEKKLEEEKQKSQQNTNKIREIETKRETIKREIEEKKRKNDQLTPRNQLQQKSYLAVVLAPGFFTRDDGKPMNRVELAPAVKNLKLQLLLKNVGEYESFQTRIKTVDTDTEIFTSGDLKAQGKGTKRSLALDIPSKLLNRGDYKITLFGKTSSGETEEITIYYLSVVK